MAAANIGQNSEGVDPRAKKAVFGAWLGFYVDLFDIYLPIVVLAPAIGYFISPELGTTGIALVSGSIFAATLIGRPVGAAIFGHFADTIGRKRTAEISVMGFGVATLLIGLLPGYQQWGVAAVVLLIVLRFIDGVFLGGEYTAANPLAMEYSPREKRGYYSGLIDSAFPLAYASISLITLLLLFWLPSEGIGSPYVQWGWRIPFFIGAALAFGFVVYYRRTVSESELWQHSQKAEAPIRSLFRGENLKSFLQVFLLMSGLWLSLQTVAAVLPGVLGNAAGLSSTQVTVTLVVAYLVLTPVIIASGAISQVIGRRPFFIGIGVIMAIVATLLYYLIISQTVSSLFWVVVLTSVIVSLVVSPFGLTPAYVNERFRVGVRASGYGLAYSLAVVIPSFYAFYQAGLSTFMPFEYTVLALLVVGGVLIAVGAAWGPETKDVDFSADASATATGPTPGEEGTG
ncbi:MAG: MFS transporter [Actinomycetota bacterium]|nr:MFS transporter [Actinomycetota bacterium]